MKIDKVVEIRYVGGRRAEVIEAESAGCISQIRIAEHRYALWLKKGGMTLAFHEWIKWHNDDKDLLRIWNGLEKQREIKFERLEAGLSTDEEVSLEDKVASLLAQGWSLKGDLVGAAGGTWVQAMVRYSKCVKPVQLLMPPS
jgi:hypothetical protein